MTSSEGTVLAFDYGSKRIGVAVGETVAGTARPLGVVAVRRDRPDWDAVARLIEEWEPARIVVGRPGHADGTPHRLLPRIQAFARRLRERFGLPVDLIDERLSSVEADRRTDAFPGVSRDALAAQVILETWFSGR
jgi:putative Holliday junction resolvase